MIERARDWFIGWAAWARWLPAWGHLFAWRAGRALGSDRLEQAGRRRFEATLARRPSERRRRARLDAITLSKRGASAGTMVRP